MAIPIKAVLSVSTRGFTKGMGLATKAVGGLVGLASKLTLVLTAVTAAFTALTLRQAAYIDRLGKVAKVTGLSAETLQKFRFAAEQAGVSGDNASLAIRRFSRRLGEAQKETGELLPALKKLGISTRDADGSFKSAEEVLLEFADGISNTSNESEKLALAFKAFDSEGAELVTTLNNGAEGLQAMFTQAELLGGVLSTSAIQGVEDFNDALNELKTLAAGVANNFVAALAPALEEITNEFTTFLLDTIKAQGGIENFGKFIKDQFLLTMVELVKIFEMLANVMINLFNVMMRAGRAFDETFGVSPENIARLKELKQELADITKTGFPLLIGPPQAVMLQLGQAALNGFKDGFTDPERAREIQEELSAIFGEMEPVDFSNIIDLLLGNTEENKEKAKKVATDIIEEVVVTGERVAKPLGDRILDALFGVHRVDEFIIAYSNAGEEVLKKIAAVANLVFGPELVSKIKEAFANSDIGDFTKTLADGFVKAAGMFEDALAEAFVKGKADFQDLADFIKVTLAKAFIQKTITGPLMALFGLASGGPAKAGQPYIVGEEGPELFIPKNSGTVIPNDITESLAGGQAFGMGGGQVTYNINAVDAPSFQQLVASDPQFIYAVTQAGARTIPGSR